MKTLTVFTPAYNRAHTIGRTYESLCRQTCQDFEWLVVDDGSRDNTGELIKGWIQEGKISIRYIYQQNQGMHGAHNTAYDNITTELNTCIDSDDYMPDDAVENIISFWTALSDEDRKKYAGIIGLDYAEGGGLIGTEFPKGWTESTLSGFYRNGGSGDKKVVLRTDIVKKYPKYPLFEGERYFSLGYLYRMIDQDYKMLVINKPLVIVEYQLDGSSHSMYKQYWNNPKGFAYLRKYHMQVNTGLKERLRTCIHYVSHSIRCKNWKFIQESPLPFMTICAIPAGVVLYFVTKRNVNANIKMKIN